jgi:transcriptional regulator with XRE-family HTH domain
MKRRVNVFLYLSCIFCLKGARMAKSQAKTKVAQLRQVSGLSVEEFADFIGKSVDTVRSLESGRLSLSRGLAEEIQEESGVNINWLLNEAYKGPPVDWNKRALTREQLLKTFTSWKARIEQWETERADRFKDEIPGEMAATLKDILKDAAEYPTLPLALYYTAKLFEKLEQECLPPKRHTVEVAAKIEAFAKRPRRPKKPWDQRNLRSLKNR